MPTMYLEVSEEWLKLSGETSENIWKILRPMGYSSYKLGHSVQGKPILTPVLGYSGAGDYLFSAGKRAGRSPRPANSSHALAVSGR